MATGNMISFPVPRPAKVVDEKYEKYADEFAKQGLRQQTFRATSVDGDKVFILRADLAPSARIASIRRNMVQFLDS